MTEDEQLELDASDAFYQALLDDDAKELYENAPCGYLSMLPDGTIVKVNGTFLAWSGYDRAALVGRVRFHELLPPGDRIFYETHYAPMLHMQGSVREIAVELVLEDGSRLPVLLNSVAKTGDDGTPMFVRTALFDARERRAYEQELLAARRRAEESEANARALAVTLQASFLPPAIPSVPFLDVGGAYRPAGDGSEVGGDFYDVFETGRGTWGVSLGDVSGKGAAAAVVTSLARHTIRAEALRTESPGEVLAAVHDAMDRYHADRFCTAVFATFRLTAAGVTVAFASGGHHLPLVVTPAGDVGAVGAAGPLLGMVAAGGWPETELDLGDGTMVLFSDGVVEARQGREWFGEDGISRVLAETAGKAAQEVADALVHEAVEFQKGQPRDDIVVVVARPSAAR